MNSEVKVCFSIIQNDNSISMPFSWVKNWKENLCKSFEKSVLPRNGMKGVETF